MKKVHWMLGVALAALLAWTPALLADDEGNGGEAKPEKVKKDKKARANKNKDNKKARANKGGMNGYWAILAKTCNLSDDQKKQMEEKIKARDEALSTWDKANKAKMDELRKTQAEAKKDESKKAEAKKAGDDLKKLRDERKKIEAEQKTAILSVLTDEQKATWAKYEFTKKVMGRYGKAKLDADQKTKAEALCATAMAEMAKLGNKKEDRAARGKIEKKLHADITALLTDEQKQSLQRKGGPKKEKPAGGAKEKGKRGGKKDKKDKPAESKEPEIVG